MQQKLNSAMSSSVVHVGPCSSLLLHDADKAQWLHVKAIMDHTSLSSQSPSYIAFVPAAESKFLHCNRPKLHVTLINNTTEIKLWQHRKSNTSSLVHQLQKLEIWKKQRLPFAAIQTEGAESTVPPTHHHLQLDENLCTPTTHEVQETSATQRII